MSEVRINLLSQTVGMIHYASKMSGIPATKLYAVLLNALVEALSANDLVVVGQSFDSVAAAEVIKKIIAEKQKET